MSEKQISKMMGNLVAHQSEYLALPVEYRQWILENPKEAIAVHLAAVRKFLLKPSTMNKVWRRLNIVVKTYKPNTLLKFLERASYQVSEEAKVAIQGLERSDMKIDSSCQLVKISPRDLGFRAYVAFDKFLQAAWASGLTYLPQGIGAILRFNYEDQPAENCLGVISEPFEYKDDIWGIFALKHIQRVKSLGIYKYRKNIPIDSREEFVFAIAEKKIFINKQEKI